MRVAEQARGDGIARGRPPEVSTKQVIDALLHEVREISRLHVLALPPRINPSAKRPRRDALRKKKEVGVGKSRHVPIRSADPDTLAFGLHGPFLGRTRL